jgi:hypothetical protein
MKNIEPIAVPVETDLFLIETRLKRTEKPTEAF